MATGYTRSATTASDPPDRDSPEAMGARSRTLIQNAVETADADGAVVCLSGGVDSATTAALAVDALGASAVTALILPTDITTAADVSDARSFADSLGIDHETVPLDDAMDVFKRYIAPRVAPDGDEYAAGNLAARLRMACAYLVADVTNALVVGTSNRSERLMGYFTKYGDGAADVFPLSEYDKTAVRALATHLDVPEAIVSKPPTAGFWPGQTDESELGAPYTTLDRVLTALIPDGDAATPPLPVDEATGADRATIGEVVERISRSAHKRERIPTPSRPITSDTARMCATHRVLVRGGDRACEAVNDARELIRTRVEDANANGIVVDLDAGVESVVTAAIAVDALGPDRVRGVHLPCHKTAGLANPTPTAITDRVGIDCDRVTIRPLVTSLESALPARISEDAHASELADFVSRVRMACTYYVANAETLLVAGTTTRTDALLGNTTPYGDGAADLRPLGGVYASELAAVSRALGVESLFPDERQTGPNASVDGVDRLSVSEPTVDAILASLVDCDFGIERTATDLEVDRDVVSRYAELHVSAERTGTAPPTAPGEPPRQRYFHEVELKFESGG